MKYLHRITFISQEKIIIPRHTLCVYTGIQYIVHSEIVTGMKTTKLKIVLNSSNLNIIPDYILDSLNRDVDALARVIL